MDRRDGDMLFAVPPPRVLRRIRRRLGLPSDAEDVYLAYGGLTRLRLVGFLVACRGNIDQVIAICPLGRSGPKAGRSGHGAAEVDVSSQLSLAGVIAARPELARRASGVIWLGDVGDGTREVPRWLYATACVPVTREWDGELVYPRPFCPNLFGAMAGQPAAIRWLTRRRRPDEVANGGSYFATRRPRTAITPTGDLDGPEAL